ncbi:MAG: type III-A CRISPR-associated protein Cas10/Csm1 [Thermodesulforhabdaceae bacterium]
MGKEQILSERTKYCLMALLHNLWQFRVRAFPEEKEKHENLAWQWLRKYYDEALLRTFFQPESDKNLRHLNVHAIFLEAIRCVGSVSHEDVNNDALDAELRLLNPFSRVRNPQELDPSTFPDATYLPLPVIQDGVLKFGWHVPAKDKIGNKTEDYRKLWSSFEDELEHLKNRDLIMNVDAVLHLLDKYTSCIPSSGTIGVIGRADQEKIVDISLFDNARTTAAIMLCLLDYYSEKYGEDFNNKPLDSEIISDENQVKDIEKPFLLVGGDISGVQRFIYTITSKGALKSLKGRSFFLELLLEHTVDQLLEKLELFRCNVVFTGGGHFYLICPNTKKARSGIEDVAGDINDFLRKNFAASLELFICYEPFSKAELKNVSPIWRRLSEKLEAVKKRPWEKYLDHFFSAPEEPHPDCYTAKCDVCGREDVPLMSLKEGVIEEVKVCKGCKEQFLLGEKLHKASRSRGKPVIYRWDSEVSVYDLQIGNSFYKISGDYSDDVGSSASVVYHLNEWDLNAFRHNKSRPLLAGIYIPPDENITDLETMVDKSYGMERLGVLRMDVDYLGRIFSRSVPENERNFSLMATLSYRLSLFFKYHLNGILSGRDNYPPKTVLFPRSASSCPHRLVSIVYSGGDDLFLIGHWLDVLEAALDVQKAFRDFTANPFITLSGGFVFGYSHDPVYRLAELAGRAEGEAKSGRKNGQEDTRKSIAITENHVFPWKSPKGGDVEALQQIISYLSPFMKPGSSGRSMSLVEGGLSMGFLYRLLDLMRRWRNLNKWIHPKLAYLFGRTRVSEDLKGHLKNLQDYVFSTKIGNGEHVEVGLMLCIMMIRRRSDEP